MWNRSGQSCLIWEPHVTSRHVIRATLDILTWPARGSLYESRGQNPSNIGLVWKLVEFQNFCEGLEADTSVFFVFAIAMWLNFSAFTNIFPCYLASWFSGGGSSCHSCCVYGRFVKSPHSLWLRNSPAMQQSMLYVPVAQQSQVLTHYPRFECLWYIPGLLKVWVAKCNFGAPKQIGFTNEIKIFVNFTRKLKVDLQWIYLYCIVWGNIMHF